jgi:hypothetical protein
VFFVYSGKWNLTLTLTEPWDQNCAVMFLLLLDPLILPDSWCDIMVLVFSALTIAVGDPDMKEHVSDEECPKAGTNGLIPHHIMLRVGVNSYHYETWPYTLASNVTASCYL